MKCGGCGSDFDPRSDGAGMVTIRVEFFRHPEQLAAPLCSLACVTLALGHFINGFRASPEDKPN